MYQRIHIIINRSKFANVLSCKMLGIIWFVCHWWGDDTKFPKIDEPKMAFGGGYIFCGRMGNRKIFIDKKDLN